MLDTKNIYILMGVSGTGKSTIGNLLSNTLDIPFFDGDDFHPKANIKKMGMGKPLNDKDREGWLLRLNKLAQQHKVKGVIIACSALKESYRKILNNKMEGQLRFIYLEGSFELIKSRLDSREEHFMTSSLLKSQFDTLEPPKNAIKVSISLTPEEIIKQIIKQIQ
ncbi:MAG: gluconokinase [Flavobacteriaceae bacterium]